MNPLDALLTRYAGLLPDHSNRPQSMSILASKYLTNEIFPVDEAILVQCASIEFFMVLQRAQWNLIRNWINRATRQAEANGELIIMTRGASNGTDRA